MQIDFPASLSSHHGLLAARHVPAASGPWRFHHPLCSSRMSRESNRGSISTTQPVPQGDSKSEAPLFSSQGSRACVGSFVKTSHIKSCYTSPLSGLTDAHAAVWTSATTLVLLLSAHFASMPRVVGHVHVRKCGLCSAQGREWTMRPGKRQRRGGGTRFLVAGHYSYKCHGGNPSIRDPRLVSRGAEPPTFSAERRVPGSRGENDSVIGQTDKVGPAVLFRVRRMGGSEVMSSEAARRGGYRRWALCCVVEVQVTDIDRLGHIVCPVRLTRLHGVQVGMAACRSHTNSVLTFHHELCIAH